MKRYTVGLTGASGIIYGITLIRELLLAGFEVHVIVSQAAELVLNQEQGWQQGENAAQALNSLQDRYPQLIRHDNQNIAAPIASGSYLTEAMIILPCTMATLSALAQGSSNSLIERAADVMLKENRPLIVVPRETPLSIIHIRNMLLLAEAGGRIVPAMPAFYHHPQRVQDLVDFMVGKILDMLKVPNKMFIRYEGD